MIVSLPTPKKMKMASENIIEEKKQGQALVTENKEGNKKKLFIESYGCQMNLNDSEIVASILAEEGFNTTPFLEEADLVLVNTCSIREKAEQTIPESYPMADQTLVPLMAGQTIPWRIKSENA